MTTVFDPRFKLTLIEFCFGKLGKSDTKRKIEDLRVKLTTQFESYENKSICTSSSKRTRETNQQSDKNEGHKRTFDNCEVSNQKILPIFLCGFIYFFFCFLFAEIVWEMCRFVFKCLGLIVFSLLYWNYLINSKDFFTFRKGIVVSSGKSSLDMYLDDLALDMKTFWEFGYFEILRR